MRLEIDIDRARIDAALGRLMQWPFPGTMPGLGSILVRETKSNLLDRKADQSTGRAFAPWSPNYHAPKHAGHELLFLTGEMAGSIRYESERAELRVGASSPAQFHVHGKGRMHRDFLSVGPVQESAIVDFTVDEIRGEIGA